MRVRRNQESSAEVRLDGTRLIIEDTWEAQGKQPEFFRLCDLPPTRVEGGVVVPGVDEILFHGSIRGGKSQACCKKIVEWAMRYGGTYGVGRSTLKELDDSTKKIMLDGDGDMPPACPPELIAQRWDGMLNKVELINGAEILFRSLEPDERGKIRNVTYAGFFIDQVEELTNDDEEFYVELKGRISDPLSPRKMILAANPGPEDHFICVRFGAHPTVEHKAVPTTRQVHVSVHDNPTLDPAYVANLLATKDTNPDYYNRMVLGLWGAFSGRRFKVWNNDVNIYDGEFTELPHDWTIIEAIDYGYAEGHAFCVLWIAVDPLNQWWVLWEHWEEERTLDYHADVIREVRNGVGLPFKGNLAPSITYLDPSSWRTSPGGEASVAVQLNELGIYVTQAINERIGGWALLDRLLGQRMPDGYGRLRIMPWCEHTIQELRSARIKAKTNDIEKVNDNAIDTLRYGVMSMWEETPEEEKSEPEVKTRTTAWQEAVKRHKQGPPRVEVKTRSLAGRWLGP